MENFNKVEFYEKRDFGDKLNITFAFIRQNARSYFRAQLYISGPLVIVATILYALVQYTLGGRVGAMNSAAFAGANPSAFFSMAGLTFLIYLILILIVALVTYSFLREYEVSSDGTVAVGDVRRRVWSHFGSALAAAILIFLIVMVSFFFFILPAVYFFVALSLFMVIIVNENAGPVRSIGRSFNLVKGKWWSTFGLLFITSLIATVINYVIQLPVYLIMVTSMLNDVEGLQNEEYFNSGSFQWISILSSLLSSVGMWISGIIVQTALAFQYYNLVEMKESRGLLGKIGQVGSGSGAEREDEGEY